MLYWYLGTYCQCCGSRMFIPDPNFFHPGSRTRIKEFKYFSPQNIVSKLSEIWSRLFIPDPDPDFLPISDPGATKAPDPGSGSATLPMALGMFAWTHRRPLHFFYVSGVCSCWKMRQIPSLLLRISTRWPACAVSTWLASWTRASRNQTSGGYHPPPPPHTHTQKLPKF